MLPSNSGIGFCGSHRQTLSGATVLDLIFLAEGIDDERGDTRSVRSDDLNRDSGRR
jgi:hypothetical protein